MKTTLWRLGLFCCWIDCRKNRGGLRARYLSRRPDFLSIDGHLERRVLRSKECLEVERSRPLEAADTEQSEGQSRSSGLCDSAELVDGMEFSMTRGVNHLVVGQLPSVWKDRTSERDSGVLLVK